MAKNIAIHFIIECEIVVPIASGHSKQFIELIDSYIVLPAFTKVCDIASEAIEKLDLANNSTLHNCHGCACYILMRHWKPLNVEYICDVTNTTLSELVGDFPNFVTIKIRFFRKSLSFCDSRDRLLMLLSQAESLVRNGDLLKSSESDDVNEEPYQNVESMNDTCQRAITFGSCQDAINLSLRKYHSITPQRSSNKALTNQNISSHQINHGCCSSTADIVTNFPSRIHISSSSKMDSIVKNLYNQRQWDIQSQACKNAVTSISVHSSLKKSTRERVTFDPTTELPILLRMFEKTRHPTREQIEQLLCELSQFRKGKKPLEFFNIQYWFKNARAMCKRTNIEAIDNDTEKYSEPNSNNMSRFLPNDCNNDVDLMENNGDNLNNNTSNSDDEPQNLSCNFSIKAENTDHENGLISYEVSDEPHEDNVDIVMQSSDSHIYRQHVPDRCCSYDERNDIQMFNRESNFRHIDSTNGKFRRNRVFIDPTSEIPILERWFSIETHPTSALINTICDEINNGAYRQQYQKLRPRNIQLWFKNHRAKLKRVGAISSKGAVEDSRLSPLSASTVNSGDSGINHHEMSSHQLNQSNDMECISAENGQTTSGC